LVGSNAAGTFYRTRARGGHYSRWAAGERCEQRSKRQLLVNGKNSQWFMVVNFIDANSWWPNNRTLFSAGLDYPGRSYAFSFGNNGRAEFFSVTDDDAMQADLTYRS
jgi:tryptophan synthase beta subunit